MTFDEIGYYLSNKEKNKVSRRKYGENYSKFAALLGLVSISDPNNSNQIDLSVLGHAYCNLQMEKQEALIARLMFRMPIIQHMFIDALKKEVVVAEYMHGLSEKK